MGINDRDYMRDEENGEGLNSPDASVGSIIWAILQMLIILIVLLLSFRVPMMGWMRVPFVCLILYFGWRWIIASYVKKANRGRRSQNLQQQTTRGGFATKRRRPVSELCKEGQIAETRGDYAEAIRLYQEAAGNPPQANHIAVRLLACYDSAGELGKAKALINHLDGCDFQDSVIDELEALVEKYFPVQFRKTTNGVRMKLV